MESFDRIDHAFFMREAIVEAQKALLRGDRPIGAAVAHNGQIVARGSNTFATDRSPIAHAEMNALLACAPYLYEHGHDCVIYTTCEPCVMCLGAIVMANIRSVVFGMPDYYIRARSVIDNVEYVRRRIHNYVGGVLREECIELYKRYSEQEANLTLVV